MRTSLLDLARFSPVLLAAACVSGPPLSLEQDIAATIEKIESAPDAAARLRADVAWIADDAREGRDTGSQGHVDAATYVAARMERIGLQPGADGEWMQDVPFISAVQVPGAASMSITGADGENNLLVNLEDFVVSPSLVADEFRIEEAEAVFVGYGIHAPEFGHDDYEGVDVDGKIVVYFSGVPDIFDNESRAHFNSGSVKINEASERGAVGAISLSTRNDDDHSGWPQSTPGPVMTWQWPDGRADTSGPNIRGAAVLHPAKAPLLFEGAAHSYADVRDAAMEKGEATGSFDLAIKVSMAGALTRQTFTSPNVVGLIPGRNPELRDEYVVLTAHLDHVGIDEADIRGGKDGINNGAMDNAIGVATLLEAARDFMGDGAPARSILIVALTAEEKGLLGADYFAHFPTTGDGEMVANVNLDMPVMLHSFTDVIAFGAERSSIGPIMRDALENAGIALSPDPIPELGIFTRSDHYRFVEQGVPSIFLWTGFANGGEKNFWDFYQDHYHRPSDDLSLQIRYKDLARFAEVNYIIARALADGPQRPVWNEGDFFGELFSR